jgi:glycine cleavage system H protein
MADDLIFLMGKYEARVPCDRLYSKNHLWLKPEGAAYQVGFTGYSVRLLKDVYFLGWSVDPNSDVRLKQEIGEVESSKAVSSLYAPFDGRIIDFNPVVLNDPSMINTDGYGKGWLYTFSTTEKPLTPEEYVAHLESTWAATERMLKGQANQD